MGEPLLRGWYAIKDQETGMWLSSTCARGGTTGYGWSSSEQDAIWYRTLPQAKLILGRMYSIFKRHRSMPLAWRKRDRVGPTGLFVIVKDDTRISPRGMEKRAKRKEQT